MSENRVVIGVFLDHTLAEQAVQELHAAGLQGDQIGVVVRNASHNTAELPEEEKSNSDETAAITGAVAGGLIGGAAGTALSFLIPGGGSTIVGKALGTALGGAALGAAAGSLITTLVKHGVPEEDAHYYESELQSGRTIVIVQADEMPQEVFNILERNHAYNANDRSTISTDSDPEATEKLAVVNKAKDQAPSSL